MMNKKEANVLMKEYLDKLLQKQMINQSAYDQAIKKFAGGGVVVDPLATIKAAAEPEPIMSMTPAQQQALLDQKIETAKANTVTQAAKTARSPLEDVPFEQMSLAQKAKSIVADPAAAIRRVKEQVPITEAQFQAQQEPAPMPEEVPDTVGVFAPKQGMQQAADRPLQINPAMELKQETNQQFDFLEDAVRQGAALGSQQAAAESAFLNQQTKDLQILAREQAVKEQEIAKVRMDMEQKISDLSQKATEAAQIDPNRWWNSRSTGQKVLAAIGLALGGSGSAEIINNYINQDIEAQKAGAQGKQRAVTDISNLYQQNLASLKDELTATLATRDTMLGIAELKLKSLAAQTDNRQVQINAQIQLGELQLKKAQVQRDLQQQIATQAFLAGGAQSGNAALMARLPKEMRELVVTTADGQTIVAKTADAQKKLSEIETVMPNLLTQIRELKKKIGPNINPFSKEAQEANALRNQILLDLKSVEQMGTFDRGLFEFAEELIPPPTSLNFVKTNAAYDTIEKRFQRVQDNARTVYGMNYRPLKIREPNK